MLQATGDTDQGKSQKDQDMSIQKMIIDMQNDVDVLEENFQQLELVTSVLVLALRSQPCRCQMKGGPRWHLKAQMEIEFKCSRCMALEMYEEFKAAGISKPSTTGIAIPSTW